MKKYILTISLLFSLSFEVIAQYADTINYTFRIGSAFDFLNSNLTFNKVYGEVKYCKNNLILIDNNSSRDSLHFGFELGGYTGNSLTQTQKNYSTYSEEIDLSYKSADSISIIKKNSIYNLQNGYQQFSLNAAPYLCYTFGHHFKIGLGLRAELFRFTNYTKLSDEINIRTDTIRLYSPINSVHRLRTIRDSIGNTSNDGYFGLFVPISIFSRNINIRLNNTFGIINSSGNNQLYKGSNLYSTKGAFFFLIETTITNPRSGISIQANIRGLFPNQTPIYNVFVSKSFSIDKIYEAVTN
jgi:hypothetical protein